MAKTTKDNNKLTDLTTNTDSSPDSTELASKPARDSKLSSRFRSTYSDVGTRLNQSFSRRLVLSILALIIAAAAGFAGGQLAGNSDNNLTNGSLSNQKKIVTSSSQLINRIASDVGPSVVSINVTATSSSDSFFGFGQSQTEQAAGTGIIISKGGVIMTNRHVVPAGTTNISVTLSDGTKYDNVDVLGRTSQSDSLDVAFLKINNLKGKTLVPASIGDSSSSKVGDSVVAIGNALGQFQNTVTSGIISGFGRNIQASSSDNQGSYSQSMNTEDLGNLIQTDAAINEGNSGGPLVDMSGQVIGMNTAIASDAENIGFAIPINDVKGLIAQVLTTGKFQRPYLGVRYVPVTTAVAKQYELGVDNGAYIVPKSISGQEPVVAGSPASKAGLRGGDIITAVNGNKVTEKKGLTTLLNGHQPGDKVTLTVVRGGKTIKLSATLGNADSSNN